ncbi:GNAT family N-acetyltransferase [soil metagenome]
MQPVAIRAVEEQDFEGITSIYAHHVLTGLASFEEIAPDRDEMIARWRNFAAKSMPYLVAERDGRVVGYSYASPYRTRSAYRFTIENAVYVDKDFVGHGIGGALLSALIKACAKGPWRQMVAVIGNSGNTASIALHERLGFRMVGTLERVGYKHGRWVDTVLMQRTLGAGAAAPPP